MRFHTFVLGAAVLADCFLMIKAVDKGTNHLRKFEKKEAVSFEDEVEQEVMGLWKRMLQFSVPTLAPSPAPTTAAPVVPQGEECNLQLDVMCYTISNGNRIPCDSIPPASSSSDCIKNVEFEYTVSNACPQANCTDATVTSLTTQRDGTTIDLTSSFPTLGISPLANASYVENTTLDICTARLVNVTSEVIATTPGTIGIPSFCAADNITTVEVSTNCEVQVQTKCIVKINGNNVPCDQMAPPQKISQCIYDATYTFIVSNTGFVAQEVLKLERSRGGFTLDLTPQLNKTSLAAGETTTVTETNVPIDFCSGLALLTNVDVEAVPVSIGGTAPSCSNTNSSVFNPIPTCQLGMSLNCTALLNGVLFSCDQIPAPTIFTECNITLAYSYKITNTGVTNDTLTALERTRNGDTTDILDLTRRTNLKPGESTIAIEFVNTNFCEQGIVATTATVEATPTVPNAPTCSADAAYEFPINIGCSVQLDVQCYADSKKNFSVPCEDFFPFARYNICEFPLHYVFTVTNSGTVAERVTSVESVILGGVTVELLNKPFLLSPGEVKTIEKTASSDFCRAEAELITHAVVTANTYPDGSECSSEAEHVFSPPRPPCNVTLDRLVDCTIANTDTSCLKYIASLTDFNDPKQCMVDVDFTFSLHNQGLACLDIKNISYVADLIDQSPVDITPPKDISFCPGDDLTVNRMKSIDICQVVGKVFNFTLQVNGERPDICGGFGFLELLASLQTCSIDLDVTCQTPEGNQCKLPPKIMCDIHSPCFIDFEYTGGMCSMSSNSQPRSFCQDYAHYTSNVPFIPLDNVYIIVTSSSSGSHDDDDIYFSGVVPHGTRFRVGQKGGSRPSLGDYIHVLIYDVKGGALIQKLQIHTTCADECPLYTAESFGSLAVVGFGNIHEEVLLPEVQYIFQYTVDNVGRGPVALDRITLTATADHIPKDELTVDLTSNTSLILRTNHSFQDTVTFYLPPIHHHELDVSATVKGISIPRFNGTKTCEAEANLTIFPPCQKIQCTQCPFTIYFEYTGESCAASSNNQSIHCTDKTSTIPSKAFVKVTSDGFKKTYFSGFVKVGDVIEATVPHYHHGAVLDDMVVVSVKSYGGTLSQIMKFTTTCLDVHNPLFVGDTFGAVKVLGWHNKKQGVVKDDDSSHYTCV